MGLDTSHGCWHGGYISFMHWRCKLAEVAGFPPLALMEGCYQPHNRSWFTDKSAIMVLEILRPTLELLPIRWNYFKNDPLTILLRHSDCEGTIAAADCAPLAYRLAELLPLLPDEDGGGHIGNWRKKTQTFIDGLFAAASADEPVEFH